MTIIQVKDHITTLRNTSNKRPEIIKTLIKDYEKKLYLLRKRGVTEDEVEQKKTIHPSRIKKSKYKGVTLSYNGKWIAQGRVKGVNTNIGTFNNELDAHLAYLKHIEKHPLPVQTSQFVGVYRHKKRGRYYSRISINGSFKHLGSFTDELEASKAYQKAKKELYQN